MTIKYTVFPNTYPLQVLGQTQTWKYNYKIPKQLTYSFPRNNQCSKNKFMVQNVMDN